jgi:hypothetical protein
MNPTKITIVSLYESSNPSALLLLLFTKHLLMTAARSPAPVRRCSYKLEHWFTMAAGLQELGVLFSFSGFLPC